MQPGNYLSHAAPSISLMLARWKQFGHKSSATPIGHLLQLALTAPRFLLPTNGVSVSEKLTYLKSPVRLPFPTTVAEFATTEESRNASLGEGKEPISKYIVVAREIGQPEIDLHIEVFSFVFLSRAAVWVWSPAVAYIPTVPEVDVCPDGWAAFKAAYITPEVTDGKSNPHDDMGREVTATLSLVQALQCSNVETEIIPAPDKLNKHRVARGAIPFSSYHILTIKNATGQRRYDEPAGSHASPRQHLRRGHIRRTHRGQTVWVNQHIVGRDAEACITKDYRVSA